MIFFSIQELIETRTKTVTSVDELDSEYRADYETKLQDALISMRQEQEGQIQQVREEVEELYERKVRL